MSLSFDVVRGLGDNPGPEITCKYFADEHVFGQVGRVAIDKSAPGLKIVTITLAGLRRYIRPGRIYRILDSGREYRAKVQSILYQVGRDESGKPTATTSLTVRMMEV